MFETCSRFGVVCGLGAGSRGLLLEIMGPPVGGPPPPPPSEDAEFAVPRDGGIIRVDSLNTSPLESLTFSSDSSEFPCEKREKMHQNLDLRNIKYKNLDIRD